MGKGVASAGGATAQEKEDLRELATWMKDINQEVESGRMNETQVIAAAQNLSPGAKRFFDAVKRWHDDPKDEYVSKLRNLDDQGVGDAKIRSELRTLNLALRAMPHYRGRLYRYIETTIYDKAKPGTILHQWGLSSFRKPDGDFIGNAFVGKNPWAESGNRGVILLVRNGRGRAITQIETEQREVMVPNGQYRIVKNSVTTLQKANPEFAAYDARFPRPGNAKALPPGKARKGSEEYEMMRLPVRVIELERISGNKDF